MFDRRLIQNFDWFILLVLLGIAGASILNLYSATFPIKEQAASHVFVRQIYWYCLGFGAFIIMTTFNYFRLERLAYPAYFVSVALLVLVLIIGKISSGSQRWLSLGPISFQPSELVKISLVLALARFFSEKKEFKEYRLRDLWMPFGLILGPFILVVKEPDLGTALLLVMVGASVVFLAKIHWKSILILVIAVVVLAPFVWLHLQPYQQRRIMTFLRPDMDPLGAGYHINQSKIAIGSGLLWGKGFLQGTQTRLHFLPEQHTDFAFSVWAEEWGFSGALFLLGLYFLIILWGMHIARNSKDKFGAMLAVGITSIIFWQVVINVGMVTGLLPVVGIPLVLFSYGGSSLVSTMAALGILMNIRMRRFMFQ
ncbi:MAG: rod shape-determining protein RodA [Deltaproteobacteria bacterium]|nr:MAG: rod shape-determining protein RodA [Deltaproteobacteria bacterium]